MSADSLGTYESIGQDSLYDCGYFAGLVLSLSSVTQKFSQQMVYDARDSFRAKMKLMAVGPEGANQSNFALEHVTYASDYMTHLGCSGYRYLPKHRIPTAGRRIAPFLASHVGGIGSGRGMLAAIGNAKGQHWVSFMAKSGTSNPESYYYYDPDLNANVFSGVNPVDSFISSIDKALIGVVYRPA